MANIRVRILILVFSICKMTISYSQESKIFDSITHSLVDVKNRPVGSNTDEIYLIVTEKNCLGCYRQVCEYLQKHETKSPIRLLVLMEKDLFKLRSTANTFKNATPCALDVLFYFTESRVSSPIGKIATSPSPQLLLKENGKYSYMESDRLMKLIKQ